MLNSFGGWKFVTCGNCWKVMRYHTSWQGKLGHCSGCNAQYRIPGGRQIIAASSAPSSRVVKKSKPAPKAKVRPPQKKPTPSKPSQAPKAKVRPPPQEKRSPSKPSQAPKGKAPPPPQQKPTSSTPSQALKGKALTPPPQQKPTPSTPSQGDGSRSPPDDNTCSDGDGDSDSILGAKSTRKFLSYLSKYLDDDTGDSDDVDDDDSDDDSDDVDDDDDQGSRIFINGYGNKITYYSGGASTTIGNKINGGNGGSSDRKNDGGVGGGGGGGGGGIHAVANVVK